MLRPFISTCTRFPLVLLLNVWLALSTEVFAWIQYPPQGFATMTHYQIPVGFIASCGCAPASTGYPTAALNQMAYGSSRAFGAACGVCFNLTLLNTFMSNPSFYPNTTKSVVVKITDLCPLSRNGWCSATESKPNSAGHYLNFDLAYPSIAIPDDFFPSNVSQYGYTDFGVWNISYHRVSCVANWAGGQNTSALGAVDNLGPEAVCCPADPTVSPNTTCTSYSDNHGLSPSQISTATRSTPYISYILLIAFSLTTFISSALRLCYSVSI